jgi:hypothetical protein
MLITARNDPLSCGLLSVSPTTAPSVAVVSFQSGSDASWVSSGTALPSKPTPAWSSSARLSQYDALARSEMASSQ